MALNQYNICCLGESIMDICLKHQVGGLSLVPAVKTLFCIVSPCLDMFCWLLTKCWGYSHNSKISYSSCFRLHKQLVNLEHWAGLQPLTHLLL